jgi:hypothetical protein
MQSSFILNKFAKIVLVFGAFFCLVSVTSRAAASVLPTKNAVAQGIAQAISGKADIAALKPVAFSGSYNDLIDRPGFINTMNITDQEALTGRSYMGQPTYIRAFQGNTNNSTDKYDTLISGGVTRIISWGGTVGGHQLGYYITVTSHNTNIYTAFLMLNGTDLRLRSYYGGSQPYDIWVEYTK